MASENIKHTLVIGNRYGKTTLEDDGDITLTGTAKINATHINLDHLLFSSSPDGPDTDVEGHVYWDGDDNTLKVITGLGNVIQLGHEVYGIGVNKTGAQLDNGTVVTMNGVQGNRPKMIKADASDASKSKMVGVLTADCANNAEGPVTTFGIVRGVNTSGWAPGTVLYLKDDGTGGFTDTAPTGNHYVWVATTLNQTNNGSIFVNPIHDLHLEYETDGGNFAALNIGDVTGGNYVEIDNGGDLTLQGTATVFLDEFGPLIGQRLESPGSNITQNNAEGSLTFDSGCDLSDYVTMNVQFNHDRKAGADVIPHIHWWQTSADTPNWLIQYRWQRNGQAKETSWTSLAWVSNAFSYSAGTLNQISSFGAITPPASDGVSTQLQIRLLRDNANTSTLFGGADPIAGDVDALSMDVHKEVDAIGSYAEYSKST